MYTNFQLIERYLRYYLMAENGKGHGVHSPFIFQFILHVLNTNSQIHPPTAIEYLRKDLLKNPKSLEILDLGAGSRLNSSTIRTVRQLAKTAIKPKKFGHLFYRLVRHYQPETIVELGTSLGITTSYMASANPSGKVVTIEGSEAIHKVALTNFQLLNLGNIKAINGNFDNVLPQVLDSLGCVDLAYIDGNHRYQPTLQYFDQLLKKSHNNTILVFDDIHWSKEMEDAWNKIKQHTVVRCTVDLFFLGIVFFNEAFKEKQHFTIRF